MSPLDRRRFLVNTSAAAFLKKHAFSPACQESEGYHSWGTWRD
jgi:hypothetical protein